MSSTRHLGGCALLLAFALGSGSCTIVKPVVGAITGPVYVIAELGEVPSSYDDGGCAVVGFLIVTSAIGATCGLVTGIISDIQVLLGAASKPIQNWGNPFAINT